MDIISDITFQMIVSIVNRGYSADVIDAARAAGAEGGTIIPARGSGVHETAKFFGVMIEPEKELVLTLVDSRITDKVLESIYIAVELEKPGKGIAFVLDVPKVVGIHHLSKNIKK